MVLKDMKEFSCYIWNTMREAAGVFCSLAAIVSTTAMWYQYLVEQKYLPLVFFHS
jgi:hypothetical protein